MSLAWPRFPDLPHDLLTPAEKSARKLHTPRFFSLNDNKDLSAFICPPHNLFVEIGEHSRLEATVTRITSDAPDFAVSLTTESAYRNDVAGIVTQTLRERFGIDDTNKMHIETCMHEAVINAVIHGNLSLESRWTSPEDFESHYAAVEQRIGKALHKIRRVNIAVWDRKQYLELRVSDDGQGFSIENSSAPDDMMPHGRGLYIIRTLADKMWLGKDRRTLCMAFRR